MLNTSDNSLVILQLPTESSSINRLPIFYNILKKSYVGRVEHNLYLFTSIYIK